MWNNVLKHLVYLLLSFPKYKNNSGYAESHVKSFTYQGFQPFDCHQNESLYLSMKCPAFPEK